MRWSAVGTVEAAGLDDLARRRPSGRTRPSPASCPTTDAEPTSDERIAARRRRTGAAPARRPVAGRGQPRGPRGRAHRQGPARGRPARRVGRRAAARPAGRRRAGAGPAAPAPTSRAAGSCREKPRGRRGRRLRARRGRAARRAETREAAYRLALTLLDPEPDAVSTDVDPLSRTVRRDRPTSRASRARARPTRGVRRRGRSAGTGARTTRARPAARTPVARCRDERRHGPGRSRPASPTSAARRCRGASTSPPRGRGGCWSSRAAGYVIFRLLALLRRDRAAGRGRPADHGAGHPGGRP